MVDGEILELIRDLKRGGASKGKDMGGQGVEIAIEDKALG